MNLMHKEIKLLHVTRKSTASLERKNGLEEELKMRSPALTVVFKRSVGCHDPHNNVVNKVTGGKRTSRPGIVLGKRHEPCSTGTLS